MDYKVKLNMAPVRKKEGRKRAKRKIPKLLITLNQSTLSTVVSMLLTIKAPTHTAITRGLSIDTILGTYSPYTSKEVRACGVYSISRSERFKIWISRATRNYWPLIHRRVASLTVSNVIDRYSAALARWLSSSTVSTGRVDKLRFLE